MNDFSFIEPSIGISGRASLSHRKLQPAVVGGFEPDLVENCEQYEINGQLPTSAGALVTIRLHSVVCKLPSETNLICFV